MAEESISALQPQFRVTEQIRQAIEKTIKCKCVKNDLQKQCTDILQLDNGNALISTNVIRGIFSTLRDEGHKDSLHEIVKDAFFVPQSVSLPPRNQELENRIQQLKIQQENKEYKRMTRNLDPRTKTKFSFKEEVKVMNRQLISIVNFVITVLAGFAFGYKGVELVVGKVFALQMMSGLILGTIIFFVDLYFMLRYGF